MSEVGHSLRTYFVRMLINVRYTSKSDQMADEAERRLSARNVHHRVLGSGDL